MMKCQRCGTTPAERRVIGWLLADLCDGCINAWAIDSTASAEWLALKTAIALYDVALADRETEDVVVVSRVAKTIAAANAHLAWTKAWLDVRIETAP